jgi:hypothetical protein
MLIYDKILQNFQSKKTGLAVLIDPDKVEKASLEKHVQFLNKNAVDYMVIK